MRDNLYFIAILPNLIIREQILGITLATRDLNLELFTKIWPQFKNKNFKSKFLVNSIFLLKHNGKYWDIFKEFNFSPF